MDKSIATLNSVSVSGGIHQRYRPGASSLTNSLRSGRETAASTLSILKSKEPLQRSLATGI